MGRNTSKDGLPANWVLDAIGHAAKAADKSYGRFVAEDLSRDPELKERLLEEYRQEFFLKKQLEEERIRIAREEVKNHKKPKKGG